MRPTEPVFKEGAVEKLLPPQPKELPPSNRSSLQGGTLVPAGATDFRSLDPVMQHHMQHQGRSIDQISSSVNNLHDTMSDLKHSFNSLRIELNGPTRHDSNIPGFDMIATVLKELKSKSDEIEKLKLEIEALKLKARLAEDSKPHTPEYMAGLEGALPRMQSPDLMQAGRKRGWADTFSGGNSVPVADTFDEDDMDDDLSITGHLPMNDSQIPLRDLTQNSQNEAPSWYTESGAQNSTSNNRESRPAQHPAQSPAKRQRLTTDQRDPEFVPGKRKPGRPKRSDGADLPNSKRRSNGPGGIQQDSESQSNTKGSNADGNSTQRAPRRPRRSVVPESDGVAGHDMSDNVGPQLTLTQNTNDGDTEIPNSSQIPIESGNQSAPVDNQNYLQPPVGTDNGPEVNGRGATNNQIPSQTVAVVNGSETNGTAPVHKQESVQAPTETENGIGPNGGSPANNQNASQAAQQSGPTPVKPASESQLNEKAQNSKGGNGRKKRKASLAARDAMIRKEMEREEAMQNGEIQ